MIGHNMGGCWVTITNNDWSQHRRMLSHNTEKWLVTIWEDVEAQYRTMNGHIRGGCSVTTLTTQEDTQSQDRRISHNTGGYSVTRQEDQSQHKRILSHKTGGSVTTQEDALSQPIMSMFCKSWPMGQHFKEQQNTVMICPTSVDEIIMFI